MESELCSFTPSSFDRSLTTQFELIHMPLNMHVQHNENGVYHLHPYNGIPIIMSNKIGKLDFFGTDVSFH